MKFFRENTERKQVTVIVEEIFNPYNVCFFLASFYKRCFTIYYDVVIIPNYFAAGGKYSLEKQTLCFAKFLTCHYRRMGGC